LSQLFEVLFLEPLGVGGKFAKLLVWNHSPL